MARRAKIVKWGRPARKATQAHSRCHVCGRSRATYRIFGLCRLCFRERALRGEIPGVRKASW